MPTQNQRRCFRPMLPLVSLLIFAPVSTLASRAEDYLAARARLHCDRKANYADVQNNASAYVSRVIELRGTVAGTAGSDDGLMLILNLDGGNAVTLTVPNRSAALVQDNAAKLRILVRVGENPAGNEPRLQVLAVATDSEVNQAESARAAQEAEYRARQKEQDRDEARRLLSAPRGELASRHSNPRLSSPPPSVPMTAPNAEAYVQSLGPRARPLFPAYYDFIAKRNHSLSPQQAATIAASLLHFADQYDVDPRLVVAMIIAESGFDPSATSKTGAMGLGQLMPGTARALGVGNAYDPVQNLNGSISYLKSRLNTFRDRALPNGGLTFEQVRLAMAAYNAGAAAVKKFHGVPPYRETQAYVRRVESLYRQLSGQ